jgi:putative sigma-54 modulation protein
MNVNVQAHHVALPSHAARDLAQRAGAVLERFSSGIARIEMTLKDINGPRGGKDKECVVRAELVDGRYIVVIDRNASMRRSIGNALRRAKLLIASEMRRRRDRVRSGLRRRVETPPDGLVA